MWNYTNYVSDSSTERLHGHFDAIFGRSPVQENTGNSSCCWSALVADIPVKVEFYDASPTQVIVSSTSLFALRTIQATIALFIDDEDKTENLVMTGPPATQSK